MTTTETPMHAGLSSAEAARLLETHGPNQLAAAEVVPAWKKFIAQFKDMLILILIGAALVSLVVSGEVKTPIVVLVVVVFNAIIGFVQENRAEKSLDALRKMLSAQVRVRRDGTVMSVPTETIVPGDVVLVEAGDRLPADGEIFLASNLEVDEAALTGESHPVEKNIEPVDPNAPIGDRHSHAFMNTTVTRGRGEILVTKTGMDTEIGRIAGLLAATPTEKTPLQRQLDGLAHQLVYLAGIVVALVMITNIARGESFGDVLLTAVALAVASIPEGLPAVTVVTLAIGVSQLASRNAIIKRLAAVETLGCTSVICSDKTGTLTLNQMTSTKFLFDGRLHDVTGSGYSNDGTVDELSAASSDTLAATARGLALCADAVVHHTAAGDELVGDPTEGALVVLAEKLGIDVAQVRGEYPRIAEVPFDSATKYMATVHRFPIPGGGSLVRIYVKGAPDVVMARCNQVLWMHDTAAMSTHRAALDAHYDAMAADGLRVLALAVRQLPDAEWDEFVSSGGKVEDLLNDLTLAALVGIVDPPRPEARLAKIGRAHV